MKTCRSAGWKRFWRLQQRNQKLRMNRMAEPFNCIICGCLCACVRFLLFVCFCVCAFDLGTVVVICVIVKVKKTFRLALATLEGLVLDLSKPVP